MEWLSLSYFAACPLIDCHSLLASVQLIKATNQPVHLITLFICLARAFTISCSPTFCQFRKEKGQKLGLIDVLKASQQFSENCVG